MTEKFKGALRPDLVIPFKLDKKAAKEAYYRHIKGRTFLPKAFRRENHIDEIKGLYVPFWLFDGDVDADVRYKATKVRMWSDHDYDLYGDQLLFCGAKRRDDIRFCTCRWIRKDGR